MAPPDHFPVYADPEDLMRRTRRFYREQVLPMLDREWGGVYHCLCHHFQDGRTHYLEAIEENLDRIDRMLAGRSGTSQ
jgi:hypothetical protein